MATSSSSPPMGQVASQLPTPPLPQGVASTAAAIPLWSWILQSVTFAFVVGLIFAGGVWKGQIETKIDQLRFAQDRQTAASDKMTDTINQVNQRLARIEGLRKLVLSPYKNRGFPRERPRELLCWSPENELKCLERVSKIGL